MVLYAFSKKTACSRASGRQRRNRWRVHLRSDARRAVRDQAVCTLQEQGREREGTDNARTIAERDQAGNERLANVEYEPYTILQIILECVFAIIDVDYHNFI